MADGRIKRMAERAGRTLRARPLIEVGCSDWYIYPHVEPDVRLAAKLAGDGRASDPGTTPAATTRAWVKRPMDRYATEPYAQARCGMTARNRLCSAQPDAALLVAVRLLSAFADREASAAWSRTATDGDSQ